MTALHVPKRWGPASGTCSGYSASWWSGRSSGSFPRFTRRQRDTPATAGKSALIGRDGHPVPITICIAAITISEYRSHSWRQPCTSSLCTAGPRSQSGWAPSAWHPRTRRTSGSARELSGGGLILLILGIIPVIGSWLMVIATVWAWHDPAQTQALRERQPRSVGNPLSHEHRLLQSPVGCCTRSCSICGGQSNRVRTTSGESMSRVGGGRDRRSVTEVPLVRRGAARIRGSIGEAARQS